MEPPPFRARLAWLLVPQQFQTGVNICFGEGASFWIWVSLTHLKIEWTLSFPEDQHSRVPLDLGSEQVASLPYLVSLSVKLISEGESSK